MNKRKVTQSELDELMTAHEAWFKNHSVGAKLELREVDLSDLNLARRQLNDAVFENIDFTGANLQGTSLYRVKLTQVCFYKANLMAVDSDDIQMQDVDLREANLVKAELTNLRAHRTSFDNALMDEIVFVKSWLKDVSFRGVLLHGANFKRCMILRCSFEAADLQEASFHSARLGEVDLRKADIRGVDLRFTEGGPVRIYGLKGIEIIEQSPGFCSLDYSESADGSDMRGTPCLDSWIEQTKK